MYLVWHGAEVATKRGNRWRCFCGYKAIGEYSRGGIRLHLEDVHKMVGAIARNDDENYNGRKLNA